MNNGMIRYGTKNGKQNYTKSKIGKNDMERCEQYLDNMQEQVKERYVPRKYMNTPY